MKYLDMSFASPEENLACDEALLDLCEENGCEEILRFWESEQYFVVVGYANQVSREVNVPACEQEHVSIFRRCTGGGTVLQGKGSLNYSLILKVTDHRPLQSISGTNQFILKRHQLALQPLVQGEIELCGHTDLTLGTHHSSLITPKKFSGNSQRRRKNYLLFHGTFLLNFDLGQIEKFLVMPSKQPNYREDRSHLEFLANLKLSPGVVKAALKEIWQAYETSIAPPLERISRLATEKYSSRGWNWKF